MFIYVLSQCFAVLAIIMFVSATQSKNKKLMLAFYSFANFCLAMSYLLLQSWVVGMLMAIATLRMIAFFFVDRTFKIKTIAIAVLLVFLAANVISTTISWETWYDFVLLGAALIFTTCVWIKDGNLIRITDMGYASLLIIHAATVSNYMGLACYSITILSILVYYLRLFIGKNKKPAELAPYSV